MSRRRTLSGEQQAGWILVSPFLVLSAVFLAYPLYRSIVLAFSQTFGAGASEPAGWMNFRLALTDPLFWTAVQNTVIFALASLFIQLPASLLLASLLNQPGLKGRTIYRLVMFMPQLVGLVFAAMIGGVFFAKRVGAVNQILHGLVGFDLEFPWLDLHIMPTLIIIAMWLYVGFNMVYFLAALQAVDRSVVEAALIDGANPVQRFIHVTIPSIRPVLTFIVLLSFIGSMQLFELPFIMLEGAGSDNRGLTIVMYLYQQAFEQGDLGMASAVGWLLGLALIGAAAVQMVFAQRESRS